MKVAGVVVIGWLRGWDGGTPVKRRVRGELIGGRDDTPGVDRPFVARWAR
jgi:hypothetical protein